MNADETLSRLEKVNFTPEQARAIADIIEDKDARIATSRELKSLELSTSKEIRALESSLKSYVEATVLKSNYDLVKWIVGGIITNGALAAL